MRTVWLDPDGSLCTTLRGRQVLSDPRINKGTAFRDEERHALGVTGLIPSGHVTLEQQVTRVYAQYLRQSGDLAKNVYLTDVHDRNEVLFYRLLTSHLSEMLPIVYTPTIGLAIEHYSHEYRRPRGVYLSVDHPELIETSLRAPGMEAGEADLIVATDAGAILGIGDWGSAAFTSPSGSSPSTQRRAGSTRTGHCPSCSMRAPTGRACLTIRSISATATPGWRLPTTTVSSTCSWTQSACSSWRPAALGRHRHEQRKTAAGPLPGPAAHLQ